MNAATDAVELLLLNDAAVNVEALTAIVPLFVAMPLRSMVEFVKPAVETVAWLLSDAAENTAPVTVSSLLFLTVPPTLNVFRSSAVFKNVKLFEFKKIFAEDVPVPLSSMVEFVKPAVETVVLLLNKAAESEAPVTFIVFSFTTAPATWNVFKVAGLVFENVKLFLF